MRAEAKEFTPSATLATQAPALPTPVEVIPSATPLSYARFDAIVDSDEEAAQEAWVEQEPVPLSPEDMLALLTDAARLESYCGELRLQMSSAPAGLFSEMEDRHAVLYLIDETLAWLARREFTSREEITLRYEMLVNLFTPVADRLREAVLAESTTEDTAAPACPAPEVETPATSSGATLLEQAQAALRADKLSLCQRLLVEHLARAPRCMGGKQLWDSLMAEEDRRSRVTSVDADLATYGLLPGTAAYDG